MKLRYLSFSLLAAASLASTPAWAASVSTTIGVSATVVSACSLTTTPIAFGNFNPQGATLTANGGVAVKCTKGTNFDVAMDKGTTSGGTIAQRLMSDGLGGTLQYNIYTTNALTTIWGDGVTGSVQSGVGKGNATNNFTAFGQLPVNATNDGAALGNYTDTVNVTVTDL